MAAVLRSDSHASLAPVLLGRPRGPASSLKGACTKGLKGASKAVKTGISAASAARTAACDVSSKLAALPVLLGRASAKEGLNAFQRQDEFQPVQRVAGDDCVPQVDGPSFCVVENPEACSPEEEARRLALEAQRAVAERRALRASRAVRLDNHRDL